jgi:hypothetical protein
VDFLKFPDESAETLEIPAQTVNAKSGPAIAVLPLFSLLCLYPTPRSEDLDTALGYAALPQYSRRPYSPLFGGIGKT